MDSRGIISANLLDVSSVCMTYASFSYVNLGSVWRFVPTRLAV